MDCHTAPAAVSDQIVAKRSLMHLSTGQAVHTAIAATAQHWAHTAIIRVCKVSSSGKCLCMGVAQERNENPTCAITWNQRIPASDIIPGIHLNLVRTAPTTNTVNCLETWLVITCTTRSYEYVGYICCWPAVGSPRSFQCVWRINCGMFFSQIIYCMKMREHMNFQSVPRNVDGRQQHNSRSQLVELVIRLHVGDNEWHHVCMYYSHF